MSGFVVPSKRHADRVAAPFWMVLALTAAVAIALGVAGQSAAQGRLTPTLAFAAGAGIGLLAMIGLPTVSIRLVARVVLLLSAIVLVRFGVLGGSITGGGQFLLLWLVAAAGIFVLSDRLSTDVAPGLGGEGAPIGASRPGQTARTAGAVAAIVVLLAVLLAPFILPHVGAATQPGKGPTLSSLRGGPPSLRSTDSLDMTQRPQLTDDVVFTVDADAATFWRGETFDLWDGRRWTRSDAQLLTLRNGNELRPGADDLSARGNDVLTQRVRIETSYADVLYAAASAVKITVDRPLRQRPDGTLISAPLGKGATYTVTSRRIPLTEQRLRSVDGGKVPASVSQRYAQPPVTTDRVRRVATRITAGASTQYDKVKAIEAWMGERVKYSLNAPLAPPGRDVVDHFLFDAEEGWCEQIASSLVVLARQNGIPARLVSGFVPGERDPVTGVYTVRAKDAHAWAEVWFPEVGWVPFDPTANVALAGNDAAKPTVAEWLMRHAVVIGLAIAAVVLAFGPLRALVRRIRARRANRPVGWAAVDDARLDVLGKRGDRPRRPDETATSYAAALALRYRDDRLAGVGRTIDDATFAPVAPPQADLAAATRVIDELLAADVPEQVALPVLSG